MRYKGRFIFDERPLKEKELNRLVTLSEIYQPYTKGILLNIKDHINSKIRKVIDIGAGTGHTTLLLKELFPKAEVTYFDYSIDLLNNAKKIAKENNKKIEFKQGDISSYPFKDKYDLVFSRFALKHFYNPQNSINTMTNILEDAGVICFIDKDVYANIWYPYFPLYKTKFMTALNKYNELEHRGGDSAIGRKMRSYLILNKIDVQDEKLILFNLNNNTEPNINTYKNIYIDVYKNLIPELVNSKLISYDEAMNDINKLIGFINNPKNTAIIIDFAIWGQKNG